MKKMNLTNKMKKKLTGYCSKIFFSHHQSTHRFEITWYHIKSKKPFFFQQKEWLFSLNFVCDSYCNSHTSIWSISKDGGKIVPSATPVSTWHLLSSTKPRLGQKKEYCYHIWTGTAQSLFPSLDRVWKCLPHHFLL